jgi:hypothetical protein
MTGQVVKRAWALTLGCWFVAVFANLLLVLADEDIRALLLVRGVAAGGMLIGLGFAIPLTLWWLVTRRGRSSSVER